jgi:DNA invertase Pin-like site-specific DNA recombinase
MTLKLAIKMIGFYIRTSSQQQNTARQVFGLTDQMPKDSYRVFSDEGISGSVPFSERPAGAKLLSAVAKGKITEVHFHEVSRAGRNLLDMLSTLNQFAEDGVQVIIHKEGIKLLDDDGKISATANLILSVLGSCAVLELEQKKNRIREGIARAQQDPTKYTGRQRGTTISPAKFLRKPKSISVRKLLDEGYPVAHIARIIPCSPATVRKVRNLSS